MKKQTSVVLPYMGNKRIKEGQIAGTGREEKIGGAAFPGREITLVA